MMRSLTYDYRPALRMAVFLLLVAGAMWLLLAPADAFASGASSGASQNCPGDGVVARIVPCISKTIEQSTYKLANAISMYMLPATSSLVVLLIIFYGIKGMSPEGNVPKTGIMFVFKIGAVMLFAVNFGGFIPAVHGGIHEIVDILANALSGYGSDQCPQSSSGSGGYASDRIWQAMDCVLGKLFGFASGKDGNAGLIASIFGLMGGFLFGGSFGIIAFLSVIGVLWSIFMFVYRAAFAFLNGLLIASFAVLISPMFIPLILLQVTGPYFQNWLKLFIGAFILPLVIVGYSVFALSIYEDVLFNKDSAASIRKVTDINFAKSITGMRTECLGTLINNIAYRMFEGSSSGGGDLNEKLKSASVPAMSTPQQSGGQGLCIKVPEIDLQAASGEFKNKQDFFRKIFTGAMSLFILAWLLSATVPVLVDIVAAFGFTVSSTLMGPVSSIEKRMQAAWDNAKEQAEKAMQTSNGSSASGVEFMERVPAMFKEMISGFTKGMQ